MAISNDCQVRSAGKVDPALTVARAGSQEALGELLERYRDYLLRIAHDELSLNLTSKVAQSDLVQDTFLQASQDFAAFAGESEWELRGWLRQILLHNLRDAERRYQTAAKRSIEREVSLDAHRSLAQACWKRDPSPSGFALREENRSEVLAAISRLPLDYRLAIELRSLQGKSFDVVAETLQRSPAAARKIWARAIVRLADEMLRREPRVNPELQS